MPITIIDENVKNYIAELEAEVKRLKEEIRWIPISKKMPDTYADVLIYFDRCGGEVGIGWYNKDKGAWMKQNGFMICYNVTHWQELPQPPEESEGSK